MNNVSLISFINLLHSASQVQLTLPGLTTLCTAEIEQAGSTVTLLRLLWSRNCETLITAEALSAGHWVDDTFHCIDTHGREVTLQLLQTTTIKPDCSTPNELDALLRELLQEANRRRSLPTNPMQNALQVAVWEGAKSVRRLLFPQMLATLNTVQETLTKAAHLGVWDWASMPQLRNQVTAALAADYGYREVTWSPDCVYDHLDSGEILDFFADLRKRTDTLDEESELVWRVLVMAVNLLEKKQLHELLQGLRQRLEDTNDDMRELCSLPR
ncbi:hypothetical protein F7661_28580 (plasmid) [Pseudomonas sp. CFA]|nr:hypothetical protein F7661_28580 [Pseudomonas sp. CFA]